MTTELKRFTGAYATMTVAAYEPLILHWISLVGIRFIANEVAYRLPKSKALAFDGKTPAGLVLSRRLRKPVPSKIDFSAEPSARSVPIDIHGRALDPDAVRKIDIPGFPNAVVHGKDVYLHGVAATDPIQLARDAAGERGESAATARLVAEMSSRFGSFTQGLKSIPVSVAGRLGAQDPGFDFIAARDALQQNLVQAARGWARAPATRDLDALLREATKIGGVRLPHMWPSGTSLREALSPIGIAHYYRQLYFNKEEGVGPIEEAFTIAPLETFEVIYQSVRKQIHEEVLQQGLETVSESAVEEKNLDEVSDKVSSMVQQDASASMSANASGTIGVWQAGASASASFSSSSQRGRELSTRRLKEVTKRASERITKSFSIKVTDSTEITTSTTSRRVIRNELATPVSYGLRRVLRRVSVKVQDLGPRLVWQLYLRNPGEGLARSRFVLFRDAAPISVPDVPPGVPPRPAGGVETDSSSTSILWDGARHVYYVSIVVKPGADRDVTGVRIESITDLESGGKDDKAPAPHNEYDLGSSWDPATRTYTANVGILPGDSRAVQVAFSYTWDPSEKVMATWQAQRDAAAAVLQEEALAAQFEQQKKLITERSKIKARPASDLRREERYEVMNRMISYLFGRGDDPSEPTPLEIEYFHRYFDIDAIFTYNHPSWWKPRFSSKTVGLQREAYEITAESEPAPLGSSLGWLLQLDGDSRRNEFLNSPWSRICIPMQAGREREAIEWLARHLEGEVGYDPNGGPLAGLLTEVEAFRERERKLGLGGPDYVTVDSTPGAPADPAVPEGVYPIVDEFDVTMPTDGFVYDVLNVVIP